MPVSVCCTLGTLSWNDEHKKDLKSLIRTPSYIRTQDEGNEFIVTLLRRLLHLFNIPDIEVSPAGQSNGVNYVLLHNDKKHSFTGYRDFVSFKEVCRTRGVLVSTGEVRAHPTQTPKILFMLPLKIRYDTYHLCNTIQKEVLHSGCCEMKQRKIQTKHSESRVSEVLYKSITYI